MTLLVSRKEETLECISFSKILSIFEIREIGRILIGIQLGQENFWKEVYRMDFFCTSLGVTGERKNTVQI